MTCIMSVSCGRYNATFAVQLHSFGSGRPDEPSVDVQATLANIGQRR